MTMWLDPADRALQAASTIAHAVATGGDRSAARLAALDQLHDEDGLAFAVMLATAAGDILGRHVQCDTCGRTACANHGTITVDVTDRDGNPVAIDDVEEPARTAWRAVLAAANGDNPTPFLLSVATPADTAPLTVLLIQLWEVAVSIEVAE